MSPVHSNVILNNTILPVSVLLVILGVSLQSKLTSEYHIRSVVSLVARSIVIVRCASKIFGTSEVLSTCFRAYVLSRLEYYASDCGLSAKSYLKQLEGVVRRTENLCGEV